jgi:hypothetical protein
MAMMIGNLSLNDYNFILQTHEECRTLIWEIFHYSFPLTSEHNWVHQLPKPRVHELSSLFRHPFSFCSCAALNQRKIYLQIHKLQSTLSSRVVASNKRGTGRVEKKQHYEITSFYSLCAFCSNTLSSLICSLGLFGYLQVLFPHHQNPKIGIIDGCCLLLMVFIYFALMVVITGWCFDSSRWFSFVADGCHFIVIVGHKRFLK